MTVTRPDPRMDEARRRALIESLRLNEPGDDMRFNSVL